MENKLIKEGTLIKLSKKAHSTILEIEIYTHTPERILLHRVQIQKRASDKTLKQRNINLTENRGNREISLFLYVYGFF